MLVGVGWLVSWLAGWYWLLLVGQLVGWLVVGFGSDIAVAQEVESATICAGQKRNTFLQVGL